MCSRSYIHDAADFFAILDNFLQNIGAIHTFCNAFNNVGRKGGLERGVHLRLAHFTLLFARPMLEFA